MANFAAQLSPDKKTLTVKVKLEKFDAVAVPAFKEAVDAAWVDSLSLVSLDFAQVNFVDSSGIGALLSIQKKLGPGGQPVQVIHAGAHVMEVIELLRLHRVFNINPVN